MIAGYTEPSATTLALVNYNKQVEEVLLRMLDALQGQDLGTFDARWLAVARTHFEQGFMAMNRAILQPQRVRIAQQILVTPDAPDPPATGVASPVQSGAPEAPVPA